MRNEPSKLEKPVAVQRLQLGGLGRVAAAAAMAAATFFGSSQATAASNPLEFDWTVTNNTGSDGNYTPAPFLTDSNYSTVLTYLSGLRTSNPNATLAVKLTAPLTNPNAIAIFSSLPINYVFADFEASNSLAQTQGLVAQLKSSTLSKNAFVGNFNLYAVPGGNTTPDATRAAVQTSSGPSFTSAFNNGNYSAAGVNMSNESAYPGSPDFAMPGQATSNGTLTAANIRSALFILPIDRVTYATDQFALGYYPAGTPASPTPVAGPGNWANIPWISRFNNYGNNLLDNAAGYQGYSYAWNTNDPNNPQYADQSVARRLLGAGAYLQASRRHVLQPVQLFQPSAPGSNQTYSSVIGYSVAQEEADASAGWNATNATGPGAAGSATIPGSGIELPRMESLVVNNYAYANLSNSVPTAPNQVSSSVATGMVLSGIYDKTGTGRQLALLLSNMANTNETVDFWQKYGAASINLGSYSLAGLPQYYTIAPGTHLLFEFDLTGTSWTLLNAPDTIFADSNRSGIGVPEPTSVAFLSMLGVGLLLRRKPRVQA